MEGLTDEERAIVETVRDFVDREVKPVVQELEHTNTYPEKLIEQMKEIGIYGLAIPEPWGEASVSTPCYVLVTEELSRGWMSLAGAMGGHTVVAKLILDYGTQEQKDALPAADGDRRTPRHHGADRAGGGSDLQAMRTTARAGRRRVRHQRLQDLDHQRPRSELIALMCKTDPTAARRTGDQHPAGGEGPGFKVSRDLPKLGYKGVESCEIAFDDARARVRAARGDEGAASPR